MTRIQIYDTTLRDGTQGEGVSFSRDDKLKVLRELDRFHVDYIEGGWPGSNPKDIEFFKAARDVKLEHARLAAFGSTCRAGSSPGSDANIQALIEVETPVVTIFGKSWRLHVEEILKTTLEENLRIIEESVRYLLSAGREVIYDAEHFFDGYKADSAYALETLAAAERGGTRCLVLCDTNGGTLPTEIRDMVRAVRARFPDLSIGIHTHNDGGLADANSLTAIEEGAVHVQGTINGLGERCGNSNLTNIIPNLVLKLGRTLSISSDDLSQLTHVARYVNAIANLPFPENNPFVGQMAFAHKGGVHVNSVMKVADSYEHIRPEVVGNKRRVLISELSGRSNIVHLAASEGIDLSEHPDAARSAVEEIKRLENSGFVFEGAEASTTLIMLRHMGKLPDYFELVRYRTAIEHRQTGVAPLTEATVKLRVGEERLPVAAGEGVGPVDALNEALRNAIRPYYPSVDDIVLRDYKVRIIDAAAATHAKVCVVIESSDRDGQNLWGTVGASTNIIEASWMALRDGILYGLVKQGASVPTKLAAR